jgi:HD-like signal output (HDOD) protein
VPITCRPLALALERVVTAGPSPALPGLDHLAAALRPQVEAMPRLTRLVVRYLALLASDGSPRALAEGLEADGVLSRWLLRQANSGYFNLPRPVVTLADALVVIGVEALTRMVFAVCTRDLLLFHLHRYPGGGSEFWKHGLICGALARALARHAGPSCGLVPEEALLAGLLHDLGKRPIDPLLDRRQGHRPVTREEERRVAGADHAAVSALICEAWELPAPIVGAIAAHHADEPPPSGALLALADAVAHRRRGGAADETPLPPGAWARWRAPLDLPVEELQALLKSARPVLAGIDEMMRLLGHEHVPPDRELTTGEDRLNPRRTTPPSDAGDR